MEKLNFFSTENIKDFFNQMAIKIISLQSRGYDVDTNISVQGDTIYYNINLIIPNFIEKIEVPITITKDNI